jgi:hypothetical protein
MIGTLSKLKRRDMVDFKPFKPHQVITYEQYPDLWNEIETADIAPVLRVNAPPTISQDTPDFELRLLTGIRWLVLVDWREPELHRFTMVCQVPSSYAMNQDQLLRNLRTSPTNLPTRLAIREWINATKASINP